MSQRQQQDGNWILTSSPRGRSSSPHQGQDSRTRSSDFRDPRDPYSSHESRERVSRPREDRYDDDGSVLHSTREKSRGHSYDHRKSESHQYVPQSHQHQSRSRSRSDFERNQMLPETQDRLPPRKVFGPQLRDIEDDDYYSSRRKPKTSRSYESSDLPDQSPKRKPDIPKKKILPQPPIESQSRPRHRSVDSLGQLPSYSRDNYGQRQHSRDPDSKSSRYHDDRIQKVVDELRTKGITRQDSHQTSRRSDQYGGQSYDTPLQVYESSQIRKVAPLKSAYARQDCEPDSRAYSNSYRDYESRDFDETHRGSRDYSNHTNNSKQTGCRSSENHNRNRPKALRGQRSTDNEDDDMEEWRRRIQSPEVGQGFVRTSRSRDHTPVGRSETLLMEVPRAKDPQRNSRSHDSVRKLEDQRLRDLTPQRKSEMSRSRESLRQVDDQRSRDHTPQRKSEMSRSRESLRKVDGQRSHDHTPQRKSEMSRSRESLRKVDDQRSRDHTPQRKSESPQRSDGSPDQLSFLSRSIEDLRSKHIYISLSEDKTKHLNRYLKDVDCRSRESLNSQSGEKKNVRPGAPSEPNEYNFNYKRRGLFIIINNKNFHPETNQQTREGTDVDAERLEERFQDLGFEVKRYDDVTRSKMSTLMYDAAAYDHSDADCFGCAILSHGVEGRVYGIDGYVSLEVLVMPFKGDKCPSLVGKPKLFFLQACRGTKMDYGVNVSDSSLSSRDDDEVDASSTVSIRKIPIEADFLFAYSTVPGYYSWRNNQDGSWFIQALCIVMENYGMKMELLHMLTHVNRIVAYEFASCTDREFTDKMKQMPCVVSMLTRYVYFRHKKQDIR